MHYKKLLIFSLLIFFSNSDVFSQELVEIKGNNKTHKFPVLEYNTHPDIAQKVNYFLQLKYLLHLPDIFDSNPFEKVLDKDIVSNDYEFINWKQRKLNDNILCIQLDQKLNGKSITYLEHFDKRTGDFFELNDLFNEKGKQNLHEKISKKIKQLVDIGKVPSLKYNVALSYKIQENKLVIVFLKIQEELELPFSELTPFFSDYGKNLLLPSKTIIRRPDMANKLLKGEGTAFNRKLNYSILIFNIGKEGKATIYRWKDILKKAEKYTDATVKGNVIQADDFYWDKFAKKKTHAYYSLHLEKLANGDWEGKLQLGSPFYNLVFKEF